MNTSEVINTRKAFAHFRKVDPTLSALIKRVGPFTMKTKQTTSVFAALAEAIVYQQLHGKAAATIFARVCALFPASKRGLKPEHILSATDAQLRGAGLSQNKMLALQDLAKKTQAGVVPTMAKAKKMSDDELIEHLTQVRGIGRWTVEMLLIFRLGRADVLPVDDFGVRKGFMITQGKRVMPTPKALREYGEVWAPHRTVAAWYMWRACELPTAAQKP